MIQLLRKICLIAMKPLQKLGLSCFLVLSILLNVTLFNFAMAQETQLDEYELILEAKLTDKTKPIEEDLVWRVFLENPDEDERLPMVATRTAGTTSFRLPAGAYLVHVAYGHSGATKRIELAKGGTQETFVLNAGGIKLNATSSNAAPINPKLLRFSIYGQKLKDSDQRDLISPDVPANHIVRLNAGTYHIISHYGDINATARANIRVEAGKLTQATLQHRAAHITFKLVSKSGGEAIADTAWSIVSDAGDNMRESTSAFPSMVLSEGVYQAIARNSGKNYKLNFEVKAGEDRELEIVAGE